MVSPTLCVLVFCRNFHHGIVDFRVVLPTLAIVMGLLVLGGGRVGSAVALLVVGPIRPMDFRVVSPALCVSVFLAQLS